MLVPEQKNFKEQMAEARQGQILMGAAQVFSEKGFHKATTKQIAKAAGVSEGTIYNYFDNKRDLLMRMLKFIGIQTFETLLQDQAPDDPKAFLTAILKDRYQLLHDRGHFMAPIIAEVFADTELRELVYQQIGQPIIGYLEQYFQQNIEAGKFRPFNTLVVARTLVGGMMLNSALKVSNLEPRYEDLSSEKMIEEIVTFFIEGVLAPKKG